MIQIKSLHHRFDDNNNAIDRLRDDISLRELNLHHEKSKYVSLLKEQEGFNKRLATVEANQVAMSAKLDAIANSVELLTSVLIPDDAKKGEKVVPVKCKPTQTLTKKDDAADGGAKGRGSSSRSNKEGKQLQLGANYPQSTSKGGSRMQSSQLMTDADIAVQTFLEVNVDANLEDLIAEEERIAQEHKENLASGKVKKIEEKTRPKQKGIVIKENVSSQSLPTRNIISDANPKDKGKAKVGETPRSTSDKAQVDTQGSKSTSDKAQVEKKK